MKEEYKDLALYKNEGLRRFEMPVNGNLALIEYKEAPGKIWLLHTEVASALEGKGAGTAIIEKTLDYIRQHNVKLVPVCPFVVAYLKRHPRWHSILAEGVQV